MGFLTKIREHPVTSNTVMGVRAVYTFVTETLWPVYSTGIVVGAICMIAASHEKQLVLDHLYGANKAMKDDATAITTESSKQFSNEVTYSIKQHVYSLPRDEFDREYAARR